MARVSGQGRPVEGIQPSAEAPIASAGPGRGGSVRMAGFLHPHSSRPATRSDSPASKRRSVPLSFLSFREDPGADRSRRQAAGRDPGCRGDPGSALPRTGCPRETGRRGRRRTGPEATSGDESSRIEVTGGRREWSREHRCPGRRSDDTDPDPGASAQRALPARPVGPRWLVNGRTGKLGLSGVAEEWRSDVK